MNKLLIDQLNITLPSDWQGNTTLLSRLIADRISVDFTTHPDSILTASSQVTINAGEDIALSAQRIAQQINTEILLENQANKRRSE